MDPRWLILAGVIAELVGIVLLAAEAQRDSAGGRRATSSQHLQAVSGNAA